MQQKKSLKSKNLSGAKGRLLEYLDCMDIKKAEFYRTTGLANGFLDKNDNIGSDNIEIIVSKYPNINLSWLVTGNGEMLRDDGNNNLKNIEDMEKLLEMLRMAMEQNRALISIIENLTHEPFEQRMVG